VSEWVLVGVGVGVGNGVGVAKNCCVCVIFNKVVVEMMCWVHGVKGESAVVNEILVTVHGEDVHHTQILVTVELRFSSSAERNTSAVMSVNKVSAVKQG
jgi:hypothetical protein